MVKKRLGDPSPDGRLLRRASSAPLSVICRRSVNDGELNNTNISNRSYNHNHKKKMKEEENRVSLGLKNEEEQEQEQGQFGFEDEKEQEQEPGQFGSEEYSARERLQRYRVQVAGSVWIPDSWGQEERLKEWVDPIALDCSLAPDGLLSARSALIHDCISNRESDPPQPPVITCSQ